MNREMKFIRSGKQHFSGTYCVYDLLGEYPVSFIQFCNEILEDAANEKYDGPISIEVLQDELPYGVFDTLYINPRFDGYNMEALKASNRWLFPALEKATITSCQVRVDDGYYRFYFIKVKDFQKLFDDYGTIEVKAEEETKKQQEIEQWMEEAPIVSHLFGFELKEKYKQ